MTPTSSAPTTPATDKPARLGRFVVREEIGRGATGVVYLAHDPVIDREVAIKTFHGNLTPLVRKQYEQQFINEARAAGRLAHAGIVTIYEVSSEGNATFIAMEYLHGRALGTLLDEGHLFSGDDVASISWKIADALDHAHRHGVIHRDIKPANIFLVGDHQPKLMDFGIARAPNRLMERRPLDDAPQTAFNERLLGTPNYMSPEQAGGHALDPRTDIYSLGAVMHEMLTGSKPFQAGDPDKLLQQIAQKTLPAPHQLVPGVPIALSRIVVKAMHKNPEKRYQTAEDMALDIKRHLTRSRRTRERAIQSPDGDQPANAPDFRQSRLFWPLCGIAVAIVIAAYTLWR